MNKKQAREPRGINIENNKQKEKRRMKLLIARREYNQHGISLHFKVTFKCFKCKKVVVPDKLEIGRAHIYALHCGLLQEVGCIA